jgi:polyisoprenoid-binding protein YceI
MKRLILLIVFIAPIFSIQAQYYYSKEVKGHFYSDAPLEKIEAENLKGSVVVNTKNNEVECAFNIEDFKFQNKLMEEHFNENYLESEKFPKATFKGKLDKWPGEGQIGDVTEAMVTGKMTMHGVENDFSGPATITILEDSNYEVKTRFKIKIADYDIKIPTAVFRKIAEEVEIDVEATLKPFGSK